MATKQGMCKNCGSLVMFDDRDELCECVFCNCVFPSAEAAKILENPDGYEFKNEKFEKNTEAGAKHYYSNPVFPVSLLFLACGVVGIILAIAFPLYFSRKALHDSISADINNIYQFGSYDSFTYKQADIYGLSCQYVKLGLSDEIDSEQAKALYQNYSKLRADKRGFESDDVEMYIYTPGSIYFATKNGVTSDVQESVKILEPTETTK